MHRVDWWKLSPAIRRIGQSTGLYRILKSYGPFDGGCAEFAEALKQTIGGGVEFIWSRFPVIPQHAVLHIDDVYIDAFGVFTEKGMLKQYQRQIALGFIQESYDDLYSTCREFGIPYHQGKIVELTRVLRKELFNEGHEHRKPTKTAQQSCSST